MRVVLSKNSYILNSDTISVDSMNKLYEKVNDSIGNDSDLFVYVDVDYIESDILEQLENFIFDFEDLRIILPETASLLIKTKKRRLYYTTPNSKLSNELFVKMHPYNKEGIVEVLKNLKEALTNETLVKIDIVSDFPTYLKHITSLFKYVNDSIQRNEDLNKQVYRQGNLIKKLEEEIKRIKFEYSKVQENRDRLLESNLTLKYGGFVESLHVEKATCNSPILYVKSLIPKNELKISNFFRFYTDFLTNKYNLNIMLIVVDDYRTLALKQVKNNFTYICSQGEYEMKSVGNYVLTTEFYLKSFMDNISTFQGIKDFIIVLDITGVSDLLVIGDIGRYIFVKSSLVREEIVHQLEIKDMKFFMEEDFEKFEYNSLANSIKISRSELFLEIENLGMEMIN